jgi:Tol biopolymer transport system component
MPAHQLRRTSLFAALAGTLATLALAAPAQATFPARNGLIVFSADTGSGSQVYTVRPNGHELRQITHLDGDAVHPDWSPDGRRIVFELGTEDSDSLELVNADGSDVTDLTPRSSCCAGQPSFAPDGKRIFFERFVPETEDDAIWSVRLDGSHERRVLGPPNGATDPNVSPNGRKLSFVGFNGLEFGQALFTAGIDGSNLFQLTPFTFDVAIKQDWAPDARHLVFTDNADFPHPGDSANIATIRPHGTDLRYLTHYQGGEVNAFAGSYSPDGRWIVFRLEDHGSYGLYKMHPDGSHLKPILGLSSFRPRFIDWGPRARSRHSQAGW